MEKMKFETPDMAQMNVEKIAALFPNCVTESKAKDGKLKKAVNFDALKQMLGESVAEGDESYEFTWVGKRDAMVEAAKPIRKTLRPCVEESKNFDTTENLYIEGDNLEALKLLQEGYLGKVKMIYIDPPYNTGNDFIYKDDFRMDSAKYAEESGAVDDEGNRMVQNSDSNGRFHSDWCSMIYSRLLLARNLLTDDGVIFISIDDNEVTNCTKICDEIFGAKNRVALICHKSRASVSNDKIISPNHNFILFYSRNVDLLEAERKYIGLDPILDGFDLDDNDGRGAYRLVPVDGPGGAKKGNPYFEFLGITGYWRFSKETMQEKYKDGLIVKKGNSLYQKYFKSTAANTRRTATTWWDDGGLTSSATSKLKDLMGGGSFDTPKPVELIDRMLRMITWKDKSSLVLDFFSGSATTAHALLQLNSQDGGRRKFIMVQVPEECNEKSEGYANGYKTICEIGKERIRRAGDKILAEQQAKEKSAADKTDLFDSASDKPATAKPLDIGFRVLKIDDSNMKDVYYSAGEISQQDLVEQISNIKDGRTDMDLLFGCLVDWGVPLSLPIKTETIENLQVYNVNDGDLVACFANDIPEAAIRQIAAAKPLRAVFRDSSFKSDSAKINVTEIFKTISPNTTVKVV
jgi:adenine-specific DNA-methyltransferase